MRQKEIVQRSTVEAVSGGLRERKAWMEDSGQFEVGNLARISTEERQKVVDEMLTEGN